MAVAMVEGVEVVTEAGAAEAAETAAASVVAMVGVAKAGVGVVWAEEAPVEAVMEVEMAAVVRGRLWRARWRRR